MTDLTKITTPLALLDDDTKKALKAHGGPYEHWTYFGEKWYFIVEPSWARDKIYRVASAKDTINWDDVADEFICMARDLSGRVYFYNIIPRPAQTVWQAKHTPVKISGASAFKSYKRGTCDWRDSLVFRPGHEPKGNPNDN